MKLTRFAGAFQAFAGASEIRRTRPPYSPEFRRQMSDLIHAGRDPADLAREFEPSAESIRAWVTMAMRTEGGIKRQAASKLSGRATISSRSASAVTVSTTKQAEDIRLK